jgi:hypothetical protein
MQMPNVALQTLRASKDEPGKPGPRVVKVSPLAKLDHADFDVVIAGGTLGLMVAACLQRKGHRVSGCGMLSEFDATPGKLGSGK